MKTLREHERLGGRVFLTGGTGYLGSLLAAQMLHDGWADAVVMPTRCETAGEVPENLERELKALGAAPDAAVGRVRTIHWTGAETASVESLAALLQEARITSVVHCAGCLDYFDAQALRALNVDFTAKLVEASKQAGVGCFVFVSTAYSAGYSETVVPESALSEPARDPTDYTLTKRAAEHVVAKSGLPFLVVRPSIVIGSSADGRYSGKRYGLYQQWMGVERLLTDRYHPELHTVATDQPLNLLHQDVFQRSMHATLRWVPDNEFVNLVVADDVAPSMKDLWRLFCDVTRPQRVNFYGSLDKVDFKAINVRQRAYLSFAQTNLEIGAYAWRFERAWLSRLQENGLVFTDTSMHTLRICQDRFVSTSAAMRRYHERFGDQLPAEIEYCDVDATPAAVALQAKAA
ncbi:SDR family oxidoreductase [Roseateles sp. LKC17W]|uniref:SDR family oxidoreductase n=1 Tax=Pelomonas margarita TaxID=3299031 RepID=A0ABW7FFS6_9BURK